MNSVNANPLLIKEVNRGIIKQALMKKVRATKKELSENTGLSVVTVNSILQIMKEENEVLVSESIPSNGGRPSQVYEYNAEVRHALVLYAHQGKIDDVVKIRVVNMLGKVVYKKDYSFKEIELDTFEALIDEAIGSYPNIAAIGFGLPGEEHNGMITINDFQKLVGMDFLSHYRKRYGLPIFMENDANAAMIGYCSKHSLSKEECIAGIYFLEKYPPGAGIIINGKIYKGKNNFGGEIAKMPIGINWEKRTHTPEEKIEHITKLSSIIACILAPEKIIIHTEAIPQASQQEIRRGFHNVLGNFLQTEIIFSTDFEEEFELGMIYITLESMENKLILTKEGN